MERKQYLNSTVLPAKLGYLTLVPNHRTARPRVASFSLFPAFPNIEAQLVDLIAVDAQAVGDKERRDSLTFDGTF